MKLTYKPLVAIVAVLALAGGAMMVMPANGQATPAKAAPTTIKTVDLVKAFNSLLQKTDGDNTIRDLKDKLEKEGTAMQKEAEAMQKELELYKSDSPEYRQTEEKVLRKVSDIASQRSYGEQRLLLEQRLKTLQIYSALRRGIEDYAKENNIMLVLMTDEPNLVDARSQQELLSKISLRKVIYAHESTDITSAVVSKLNAEWQRERNKPATPR